MKIYLRDFSELALGSVKKVRFSVTMAEDNGDPLITIQGWTIDQRREVSPPKTRTGRGGYWSFVDCSKELLGQIKEGLAGVANVERILGPLPTEGITEQGGERLEGEAEIKL